MEMNYWKKKVVLYCKGRMERSEEVVEDLRHLASGYLGKTKEETYNKHSFELLMLTYVDLAGSQEAFSLMNRLGRDTIISNSQNGSREDVLPVAILKQLVFAIRAYPIEINTMNENIEQKVIHRG